MKKMGTVSGEKIGSEKEGDERNNLQSVSRFGTGIFLTGAR